MKTNYTPGQRVTIGQREAEQIVFVRVPVVLLRNVVLVDVGYAHRHGLGWLEDHVNVRGSVEVFGGSVKLGRKMGMPFLKE